MKSTVYSKIVLFLLMFIIHHSSFSQEVLFQESFSDNRNQWSFGANPRKMMDDVVDLYADAYQEKFIGTDRKEAESESKELLTRNYGFEFPFEDNYLSDIFTGLILISDIGTNGYKNTLAHSKVYNMYWEEIDDGANHSWSSSASIDLSNLEISEDDRYILSFTYVINETFDPFKTKKINKSPYLVDSSPGFRFQMFYSTDKSSGSFSSSGHYYDSDLKTIGQELKIELVNNGSEIQVFENSRLVKTEPLVDAPRDYYKHFEVKFDVEQASVNVKDFEIVKSSSGSLGTSRIEKLPFVYPVPNTKMSNPDAVAIVIGNSAYSMGIPNVEYAQNDAALMKEYLIKSLGYAEQNIIYLENASKSKMEITLGDELRIGRELKSKIQPGESDVFIYYSGHGAPEVDSEKKEKDPYILPVDASPYDIAITGYPLNTLYNNLSKIDARSVIVVIDACFSGYSGSGESLLGQMSPVGILINNPAINFNNGLVITASQDNQVASWLPQAGHGILTYSFLAGIRGEADLDGDGRVSYVEIGNYIKNENSGVPSIARILYGREQDPQVYYTTRELTLVKLK